MRPLIRCGRDGSREVSGDGERVCLGPGGHQELHTSPQFREAKRKLFGSFTVSVQRKTLSPREA